MRTKMNDDKEMQRQYRTLALLGISKWLFLGLILLIWTLVELFTPEIDPLDRSAIKNRRIVKEIHVVDSTNNGFRVSYATTNSVTKERFDEIYFRPALEDSLEKLKELTPQRFPDMVNLDIYDFSDFAKRFDPADIQIHNIFVYGLEKEKMYVGDNPLIKNPARSIDRATAQGLLYIRTEDIYCPDSTRRKVYRYFLCRGMFQLSHTDEHFSHFSEDERI